MLAGGGGGAEGGRGGALVVVDDAEDAVFEEIHAEVDEKADLQVHENQVGFDLLGIDGMHLVGGFEFDDDFAVDKKVQPEGVFNGGAFVFEGDGFLAFDGVAAADEFDGQELLVDGFQQAGAEVPVELYGRVEDVACDGVFVHAVEGDLRLGFPVHRRVF